MIRCQSDIEECLWITVVHHQNIVVGSKVDRRLP